MCACELPFWKSQTTLLFFVGRNVQIRLLLIQNETFFSRVQKIRGLAMFFEKSDQIQWTFCGKTTGPSSTTKISTNIPTVDHPRRGVYPPGKYIIFQGFPHGLFLQLGDIPQQPGHLQLHQRGQRPPSQFPQVLAWHWIEIILEVYSRKELRQR